MITRIIGACAVAGLLFTSCTEDNALTGTVDAPVNDFALVDPYPTPGSLPDNGLPSEDIPFFDQESDQDELRQVQNLDGTVSDAYFVDGCTTMSPEHYKEWKAFGMDELVKQYHSYNLVTRGNNTIRVRGWNANNSFGLTEVAKTGLRYAVNNWNNVNTRFQFDLDFGSSTSGADIVVYRVTNVRYAGSADYPSGGNPGRFIRIADNIDNQNSQDLEQVVCHEMGHAMGFRHSNWRNRNCGESGPDDVEARDPRGAVYIPGTSGTTTNSWMKACYSVGNEDGEFKGNDVRAIEYLY